MAKITYEDKEFLNKNENIADKNKVNDTDLNEIKNVVNENDDNIGDLSELNTADKSSVVGAINELTNVFKAISLEKNVKQDYSGNVIFEVTWQNEKVNNTNGILSKNGNRIKCNSGSHLVLVNVLLQTVNSNGGYIYVRKYVDEEKKEVKTTSSTSFPQITCVCEINEGEEISIESYASQSGYVSNATAWNTFDVILMN